MTLKQLIVFFILLSGQLNAQSVLQKLKWPAPDTSRYRMLAFQISDLSRDTNGFLVRFGVATDQNKPFYLAWHHSGAWLAFEHEDFSRPIPLESNNRIKFDVPRINGQYRLWVLKNGDWHGYFSIILEDTEAALNRYYYSFICRPKTFERVISLRQFL